MFVTSRQLDILLFVSIAMTTGALAQTAVLFFVMVVPVEVARCWGVDFVIFVFYSVGVVRGFKLLSF
jgi:hypothetical protein